VLHLARVDDGHGLEAAVRVLAHATTLVLVEAAGIEPGGRTRHAPTSTTLGFRAALYISCGSLLDYSAMSVQGRR